MVAYTKLKEPIRKKEKEGHLKTKTIEQPTWVPGSGHELAYAREGQNSVVKDIMRRIERAKK